MFYSSEILSLKSDCKLGVIWLAATVGPKAKRLGRRELLGVDIRETCRYLQNPPEPLSLRLSANMMVGVTRVYGQQCHYQYTDVQGLCQRLAQLDAPQSNDLDIPKPEKNNSAITQKKIECISAVGVDLNLPDFDINEMLASNALGTSSLAATPEQARKNWSWMSTTTSATPSELIPFSDALTDADYFGDDVMSTVGSRLDQSSFLRPQSSISSLRVTPPRPSAPRKRRLLQMFDEIIMLEKDELFIKEETFRSIEGLDRKKARDEAMILLTTANEQFLPESFTLILHEYFVPEIETFRNEINHESDPIGFDDHEMPMPWHSDSIDSVGDFHRLSVGSSPKSMSSMATSPFSTPSPKLNPQSSTASTTTKSTLDFFLFLQEHNSERIIFSSLINPPKRAVAARAFHHLLELAMAKLITLRQCRHFSSIEISLIEG